jgi:hypothetical protein
MRRKIVGGYRAVVSAEVCRCRCVLQVAQESAHALRKRRSMSAQLIGFVVVFDCGELKERVEALLPQDEQCSPCGWLGDALAGA